MPKENSSNQGEHYQQGSLFEAPADEDRLELSQREAEPARDLGLEYVFQAQSLYTATNRLELGDDSYLLFPTESLKRIANLEDYSRYHTGARSKVVNSSKWRSKGETPEERAAMLARTPELKQNLGAAHINADQGLRRKIAQNVRDYDMERLTDTQIDRQAIPARLRNASKDGTAFAPFTFARDVRERPDFSNKLLQLARHYDKRFASEPQNRRRNATKLASALEEAINTIDTDASNPNAVKLIHQMGQFWTTHAQRMHEVWNNALQRYNEQFPNKPIDVDDPELLDRP